MKVVAIIQARMGSTRLPGKVLRMLGNATVLAHVVRRVQAAANVDAVIVATTESPKDDSIADAAMRLGASVFRGSEEDVLSRYYFAGKEVSADVVVRVTSDCPLLDPEVLRAMVDKFLALKSEGATIDYLSNTLVRTYPRGLDVEVFTFEALEFAHENARTPAEREHVTPYIHHHSEKFGIHQHRSKVDLSHYRWTLDTEDDFRLLKQVFDRLSGRQPYFATNDVLELIAKEPELSEVNAHVAQKTIGH